MVSPWLCRGAVLLMFITVTSAYLRRPNIPLHKPDYALPQSVTPTAYAIWLHPHINKGHFNGSVEVNITCKEPTNIVTLHAHEELDIIHVQIKNMDNNIEITNISRNATKETISLSLEKELESGVSYQLSFVFNGQLQTETKLHHEFYSNKNIGGFICNNFSPPGFPQASTYAGIITSPRSLRRVFPCFDEPSFKATFQISITHWSNMSALSMMPIESSELTEDNLVNDHFLTSPPLSTSSVNVLLVDYETNNTMNVSTKNGDFSLNFYNKKHDVYYDKLSQPKINSTAKILEYLQDYLDVPYPFPKLDVVDVPGFNYGRTSSSLGLITMQWYMMDGGLINIGEDLIDQWFKHLTTPQQWEFFNITDVLSDYMINNAVNKLGIKITQYKMPKGDVYKLFRTSHHLVDQWNIYDTLKGTWFLEMLNSSLTEKTMQTALGNLVKNNMYSTFTPDMLWEEITKQSHADGTLPETVRVHEIANSWLKNQYFPVLTIARNYEDGTAKLEQHMYFYNVSRNLTEDEQRILWVIPITYLTNSMEKTSALHPVAWMSDKEMVISNLPDANSFIIVNPTDSGMFLVNYDKQNWDMIAVSLQSLEHNISSQSRRKVVQDAMLLASSGELNYATALNVTLFLFNETDYTVWLPFIHQTYIIQQITQHTSAEPKFNKYIRLLFSPIIGSNTQPNHSFHNQEYMNFWYQARALLEKVGYQPLIDEMHTNLNKTMPIYSFYDNETELVLFCPKRPTNESEWTTHEQNMQQFAHMYGFLQTTICKCPDFIDYVKRELNKTLDDEKTFASHEFYQTINLVTRCPESYNITFNFFLQHFDELRQRFYYVKDVWNALVSSIMSKVQNQDQLTTMTQFLENNQKKFGYSNSTARINLQMAKMVIEQKDGRIQDIELWLDEVLPFVKSRSM